MKTTTQSELDDLHDQIIYSAGNYCQEHYDRRRMNKLHKDKPDLIVSKNKCNACNMKLKRKLLS